MYALTEDVYALTAEVLSPKTIHISRGSTVLENEVALVIKKIKVPFTGKESVSTDDSPKLFIKGKWSKTEPDALCSTKEEAGKAVFTNVSGADWKMTWNTEGGWEINCKDEEVKGEFYVCFKSINFITTSPFEGSATIYVQAQNIPGIPDSKVATNTIQKRFPVKITSFTANPAKVEQGAKTTLIWNTEGAHKCLLNGKEVDTSSTGIQQTIFTPTDFILMAESATGHMDSKVITVDVEPIEIVEFKAEPTQVYTGDETTVSWNVKGASFVWLNNRSVNPTGSSSFMITEETTFVLEAQNAMGITSKSAITVDIIPMHVEIKKFELSKSPVNWGEDVILEWEVIGANQCWLDGLYVETSGSKTIKCESPHTFSLKAENSLGKTEKTIDLKVVPVTAKIRASRTSISWNVTSSISQRLIGVPDMSEVGQSGSTSVFVPSLTCDSFGIEAYGYDSDGNRTTVSDHCQVCGD